MLTPVQGRVLTVTRRDGVQKDANTDSSPFLLALALFGLYFYNYTAALNFGRRAHPMEMRLIGG